MAVVSELRPRSREARRRAGARPAPRLGDRRRRSPRAVTRETRLVFVATPNNPTGLALDPAEARRLAAALPDDILLVIDEAYFDYLDPTDRLDAIEDLFRTVARRWCCGPSRSSTGSRATDRLRRWPRGRGRCDAARPAGLRRRALSQAAALASLGQLAEVERRRAANATGVAALSALLDVTGSTRSRAVAATSSSLVSASVRTRSPLRSSGSESSSRTARRSALRGRYGSPREPRTISRRSTER